MFPVVFAFSTRPVLAVGERFNSTPAAGGKGTPNALGLLEGSAT